MSTNTQAVRWPIDAEHLEPGSVIPADQVERITGLTRDSVKYSLKAMALGKKVERLLKRRYGREMILVFDHDELRVLTEPERVDYLERDRQKGIRKLTRTHKRMIDTDVNELDYQQRQKHERSFMLLTAQRSALRQATEKFKFLPTPRVEPPRPLALAETNPQGQSA